MPGLWNQARLSRPLIALPQGAMNGLSPFRSKTVCMNSSHQPVMLAQAIDALAIRDDGAYLDCTFGRGGHTRALLEQLGGSGRAYAIDKDPQAIAQATRLASVDPRLRYWHGSFSKMSQALECMGVSEQPSLDGILLDLGVSSPQLDDAERGFSFRFDGPLDMRMDPTSGDSAADWLNSADVEVIARVLWEFGEERFSRRIARAIVSARPLSRTLELAEAIARVVRSKDHKHPATRSFQAIRIFINGELEELDTALSQSLDLLKPGGRLVVISFHSLEDRRAKLFIRRQSEQVGGRRLPQPDRTLSLRRIGGARKPTAAEVDQNPRARSAVLRVAERLPAVAA